MRTKQNWLGVAAVGLVLILLTTGGEDQNGRVELNPNPPQARRWGLTWDLGDRPARETTPTPASTEAVGSASEGVDGDTADPGIWATPAEFADSD
jgi:hypothetical protein